MRYTALRYMALGAVWLVLPCLASCKKEKEPEPLPAVPARETVLKLAYTADNGSFHPDSILYTTAAGYPYSVTRLSYYLSQIRLLHKDGSELLLKKFHYADAGDPTTLVISRAALAPGEYRGIAFNIGLDAAQNISFGLPATNENIEMQWPDPMGGGYHFLKLEGHYRDSSGTHGYALHLGRNLCLGAVTILKPFQVSADASQQLTLSMEIGEWYKNPHSYDFNKDGNAIMGDDTAMKKIAENGLDVFTFIP